jgi:hypothetical protein
MENEIRNVDTILVGNPRGKRPLWEPRWGMISMWMLKKYNVD